MSKDLLTDNLPGDAAHALHSGVMFWWQSSSLGCILLVLCPDLAQAAVPFPKYMNSRRALEPQQLRHSVPMGISPVPRA